MARLITREGLKKLEDEIEERKSSVRQQIAQAIKEAKDQGDLSENAEYSEAKRQQNENETRIAELEILIKEAEVAEHDSSVAVVQIGSKVAVKFNGSEQEFQIVSPNEVDPVNFKISNESPIGKALMGKKVGDKLDIDTPKGKMKYVILAVK